MTKKADDRCVYCGHPRSDHNPPKSYVYAKNSTRTMTAHLVPVSAPTNCYSNPLCSCIAFVSPRAEGPHWFEYSKLY